MLAVVAACASAKLYYEKRKDGSPYFHEITEMMGHYAARVCKLKAQGLPSNKQTRCITFRETAEDFAARTADTMISGLNKTMSEFVALAQTEMYLLQLRTHLTKAAEEILHKSRCREVEVEEALSRDMMQWFLNVATGQTQQSGLSMLTPELRASLRSQGISMAADPGEEVDFEDINETPPVEDEAVGLKDL